MWMGSQDASARPSPVVVPGSGRTRRTAFSQVAGGRLTLAFCLFPFCLSPLIEAAINRFHLTAPLREPQGMLRSPLVRFVSHLFAWPRAVRQPGTAPQEVPASPEQVVPRGVAQLVPSNQRVVTPPEPALTTSDFFKKSKNLCSEQEALEGRCSLSQAWERFRRVRAPRRSRAGSRHRSPHRCSSAQRSRCQARWSRAGSR